MDRAELERAERKAKAVAERERVDGRRVRQKRAAEQPAGGFNALEYLDSEPELVVRRGELKLVLAVVMKSHERRRHSFFLSPRRLLDLSRSPVLAGLTYLGMLAGVLSGRLRGGSDGEG